VVVTDSSCSVTSLVARAEVDPTFTMITTGPIVTDTGTAAGVAWGDYDNDGFPDLLVGNINSPVDSSIEMRATAPSHEFLPTLLAA